MLVIGQPAPAAGLLDANDLLRIHVVADDAANATELARVNITRPAFYLLRPDGHVAIAGGQLDTPAVSRYLSDLGIKGAGPAA